MKKQKWHRKPLAVWLLSGLIYFYIRLVYATSRCHMTVHETARPYANGEKNAIFIFWHGRMMMMPMYRPKGRAMNVTSSRHGDGQLMARTMKRFGFSTVFGSTSKGAVAALAGALRVLNKGENITITPDGPRGPFEVAANGMVYLAQKTGVPVIPVSFSARRHVRFSSWDKFMLALPFNYIEGVIGTPHFIGKDDDAEIARSRLEVNLSGLGHEMDVAVGVL